MTNVSERFAKGQRYEVEIAAVGWIDLLGYGSMLANAEFDPGSTAAVAAVERLTTFHRTIAHHAHRNFRATQLNDAGVFFRDLTPRARSSTFDFLARCFDAYSDINGLDTAAGFCGARMVVAVGPRLRIRGGVKAAEGHLKNIEMRLQMGAISPSQALREAMRSTPIAGYLPSLQANFAFTKAYLVDSEGARGGFPGPNCYVDRAIFDANLPSWISAEIPCIGWSGRGMSGEFARINGIDRKAAGVMKHLGIRDAQEIRTALGVTALRKTASLK